MGNANDIPYRPSAAQQEAWRRLWAWLLSEPPDEIVPDGRFIAKR